MRAAAILSLACLLPILAFGQVKNYSFTSDQGNYIPISGGTLLGDTTNEDNAFVNQGIGFNFYYNGRYFDRFSINPNGFIGLGPMLSSSGSGAAFVAFNVSTGVALLGNGSNNIISAFNMDLQAKSGSSLSYAISGFFPRRTLVIQWSHYHLQGEVSDDLNFQIRLEEGTNIIKTCYGSMVYTNFTPGWGAQVGLRGSNNGQVNSRSSAIGWNNTSASANPNGIIAVDPTLVPPLGLTYTWAPQPNVNLIAIAIGGTQSCGYGSNERITGTLINQSGVKIDTIQTQYWINGAASPVTSIITVGVAPGDTFNFDFTTSANLSAPIAYSVVGVAHAVREIPATYANDTVRLALSNLRVLGQLPYQEDFASTTSLPTGWRINHVAGVGDWTLTGPTIETGTFGTTLRTVVGAGALFFNSFFTSLDGAKSRLATPCLDLTTLSDSMVLEFGYMQSAGFSSNRDSIQVQVSIDGGTTYSRLHSFFRPHPSSAGRWSLGQVDISLYRGLGNVRFGFLAGGAGGLNLAIDFVRIRLGQVTAIRDPFVTLSSVVSIPNPSQGAISLIGLPASLVGAKAELCDINGRKVSTLTLSRQLQLGDLPTGLYYLKSGGKQLKLAIVR